METGIFTSRAAAVPIGISAVLHLLVFVVEGFSAFAGAMFIVGLVYLAIAYGLRQGRRWLAWISFFIMLVGMIAAYSTAGTGLHFWWWTAIAIADLIAAVILFGALWKSKPVAA